MIEIIPAILPKSFAELEQGLARLRGISKLVQIDVVSDIFSGRARLPREEEFDFEFDIFTEPAAFVPRALRLGANRVVVHALHESAPQALEFLQKSREGEHSVAVGLGLRSADTPEALKPFAGLYDFVQVMGIERVGNQGEPFDERAVGLARSLRAEYPTLFIQVDGHAAGHEQALVAAGANRLVVGSAVVHADNPREAYKQIYTKANALRQKNTRA